MNGPSLIETLRSISAEEAASTETYEGYSAWTVALHTLFYKHLVAAELGADVPSYEYERESFPAVPDEADQAAWDKMIGELEATHDGLMAALESATEEDLQKEHAGWKMPVWKSLMWSISHDTSHNAQIRNMGLPSLRSAP